ncbi:MAG: hypothetical protein AAGG02_19255, partial [Cyanobacteria bacterium P01_H01_bin.15]
PPPYEGVGCSIRCLVLFLCGYKKSELGETCSSIWARTVCSMSANVLMAIPLAPMSAYKSLAISVM